MSDTLIKKIYDNHIYEVPAPKEPKPRVTIEYVNQDLNEAIQEYKHRLKSKSRLRETGNPSDHNKVSNPEAGAAYSLKDQPFFTEAYRKKLEERRAEIEAKKKQLTARSTEKQTRAKLLRKVSQNMELKSKMQLIQELKFRRQQLLRQHALKEKKRKDQRQFMHQNNLITIQTFRRQRKKQIKKQVRQYSESSFESRSNLKFKQILQQKRKQQIKQLIQSRAQNFRRNHSEKNFTSDTSRSKGAKNTMARAQTSERKLRIRLKGTEQAQQEKIIRQYSNRSSANSDFESAPNKQQRKLNKNVKQLVRELRQIGKNIDGNAEAPQAQQDII